MHCVPVSCSSIPDVFGAESEPSDPEVAYWQALQEADVINGIDERHQRIVLDQRQPFRSTRHGPASPLGYRPLLQGMYASLVKMVESGFLNEEELQQMTIPTVGRTRQEFLAPFGAEGIFAGLGMEEAEVFLGEDHIWSDYQRDGDPRSFGTRWAAFSRVSVFPMLAEALKSDGDTWRSGCSLLSSKARRRRSWRSIRSKC